MSAAHFRAAMDIAAQEQERATKLRSDTRSRLLRKLARAERLREKEEADRARKLLRRAAEQQSIYDKYQKQSDETRGGAVASTTTAVTAVTAVTAAAAAAAQPQQGPQVAQAAVGPSCTFVPKKAKNDGSGRTTAGATMTMPPALLSKLHSPSTNAKHRSMPNIPILDVLTGKWRGLWDLYRGAVVVIEFYLSSMTARSVAPVIAIDP